MNRLFGRVPFILELFINGFFIFLYAFYRINKLETSLVKKEVIGELITILSFLAPAIILVSIIGNFLKSLGVEDFIRKYVFSLIVFIPMMITIGDSEFAFWLSSVHLFSTILSLYDTKAPQTVHKKKRIFRADLLDRITLAPAQIITISFIGLIFFGTLLLMLPISAAEGKSIGFIDALFMSTSSVCVTGLSTISVSQNFSFIGQIIILALVQVGGLGYMTLFTSMTILLGRSLAVKDQVLMQDVLNISTFSELVDMIFNIIKYTVVIEIFGAILLTVAFSLEGYEFGQALYYGIFHSICAFCNAGYSMWDSSLEIFKTNTFINVTISGLVFLGGLGFIVIKELEEVMRRERKVQNLSVHSKIVLSANVILTLGLAFYIFFSEYLHLLTEYTFWEQIQISLFQSITTRSGGYNTVSIASLQTHVVYIMALWMFIGASPGSCGGGIKITTVALLFKSVVSTMKGRETVEFFDRRIPNNLVVRSIAIIVISLVLTSLCMLAMIKLEPEHSFLALFFEVLSAFGTAGLSLGITPYLSVMGKVVIAAMMFFGRIGPLTLVLAIGSNRREEGTVDLPSGRVMIG